jgi:hypothetical protein
MIAYIADTLLSFVAGFALRYYLTKDMIFSRANVKRVATWLESMAGKSEVAIRREADFLLTELKQKL